ncbi:uncharacterized protein MYCGRDRAFT_102513 [Zymoseptoria tritici IPO323]|uniref:Uncharacterized protein n=1 Tax=Zymoseptoria tritici (strain CBS 115943 / IPO323) TaxID=336722 RepID=F9X149_ZYMTI|nr:uncharacterized protein MYCGRDRAFT_102513 [Zymoseptoria tritici IPO323]EGP91326.1 hypothetical protein MYCGRDRAFT_102513 [Zymoseptoria tritici IPO323]
MSKGTVPSCSVFACTHAAGTGANAAWWAQCKANDGSPFRSLVFRLIRYFRIHDT